LKNLLKEKLQKGQVVIGTGVGMGHPDVTEILSRLGFDWLFIDGEHTPLSLETMQMLLQAMNGTDCTPILRSQWNDMVIIKRMLDIGAHGIIVPMVNTKEEAEYAVSACKYPPQGLRGCAPRRIGLFDPDYIKTANDEILVIVQIETQTAVSNIDDILSVKGVDACCVGPQDLSISFGFQCPQWDNPQYMESFDKVLAAARKWAKTAGVVIPQERTPWAIEKGFKLLSVGGDIGFLMEGARALLKEARDCQ